MNAAEFIIIQGLRYCIVEDARALASMLEQFELWPRMKNTNSEDFRSLQLELVRRVEKLNYSVGLIDQYIHGSLKDES